MVFFLQKYGVKKWRCWITVWFAFRWEFISVEIGLCAIFIDGIGFGAFFISSFIGTVTLSIIHCIRISKRLNDRKNAVIQFTWLFSATNDEHYLECLCVLSCVCPYAPIVLHAIFSDWAIVFYLYAFLCW